MSEPKLSLKGSASEFDPSISSGLFQTGTISQKEVTK